MKFNNSLFIIALFLLSSAFSIAQTNELSSRLERIRALQVQYREIGPYDEAMKLIGGKYDPNPELKGMGVHGNYVFFSNEENVDQLKRMLKDESQFKHWKSALHALGTIGSVDKSQISIEELTKLAVDIERKEFATDVDKVGLLRIAYGAVAKYGDQHGLDFLIERTKESFWNGEPPSYVLSANDPSDPSKGLLVSARSEAVISIAQYPGEEGVKYISKLRAQNSNEHDLERAFTLIDSMESEYRKYAQFRQLAYQMKMSAEMEESIQIPSSDVDDPGSESEGVRTRTPELKVNEVDVNITDAPIEESKAAEDGLSYWIFYSLGGVALLVLIVYFMRRKL
ncbi:hypothetical protein [Cerasicoccus fimbriatus]|uniref:hypothetical protein n=1 Tax=Cerasicoccus fimbriatus TaxID=3014554 RepID=UPI0022B4327C|nr:hypothetical protein [Cerasicoccus sp. TK19100]